MRLKETKRFVRATCANSFTWRLTISVFVLSIVLSGIRPASAEGFDKFRLSAGGYAIYGYDSTISLTETDIGLGATFSPEDTLGWNTEQTVFRLDGRYRFNPNHALTFSWYRISSDGNRRLLEDIEWVDDNGDTIVIPTGTSVTSSLEYDLYKIGYSWSFYQSDKVELIAGAGLHLADVGVALAIESGLVEAGLSMAESALPLPVVSFMLDYQVTSKFNWFLRAQFFDPRLNEWQGLYSDIELGMEYRAFEQFGVGVGLGSNALDVTRESGNTRFEFDNRVTGVHFFVSANF